MMTSARARSAMIWGLGLVALAAIVGPSLAQQADPNARTAAAAGATDSNGAAAAAAPKVIPAATIGVIDIDFVFKNYKRSLTETDAFKKSVEMEQTKFQQNITTLKNEMEKLSKLQPNSPDYKKLELAITEMKAKHESQTQIAERDYARREAAIWLSLYNEIQRMTEAVAKNKKLTMVVQTSNEKPSVEDPRTVMASMSRTVVYSDPRTDITNDVTYNLNYYYNESLKAKAAGDGK